MGTDSGLAAGAPGDPQQVEQALFALQPAGRPLVVRSYQVYSGIGRVGNEAPADFTRYIHDGRILDLVLCFHDPEDEVAAWQALVRETVRRYGPHLGTLQIAEEPNSAGPGGDGRYPNVRQAIVAGVIAAKEKAGQRGCPAKVGFNAPPSLSSADEFWPSIRSVQSST